MTSRRAGRGALAPRALLSAVLLVVALLAAVVPACLLTAPAAVAVPAGLAGPATSPPAPAPTTSGADGWGDDDDDGGLWSVPAPTGAATVAPTAVPTDGSSPASRPVPAARTGAPGSGRELVMQGVLVLNCLVIAAAAFSWRRRAARASAGRSGGPGRRDRVPDPGRVAAGRRNRPGAADLPHRAAG